MTRSRLSARTLAVLLACFALASCDGLLDRLTGAYHGPNPSTDPLIEESATVAGVYAGYQGKIYLTLDRQRFTTNDPHHVDRVIQAWATEQTQDVLVSLALQRGETVILTTEYSGVVEGGGSMGVSNWPGHNAMEYPIAAHRILSIARAAP